MTYQMVCYVCTSMYMYTQERTCRCVRGGRVPYMVVRSVYCIVHKCTYIVCVQVCGNIHREGEAREQDKGGRMYTRYERTGV